MTEIINKTSQPFKIWIDNDACPKRVREIIFKASEKWNIEVKLVANSYIKIPESKLLEFISVSDKFNAADDYIAESVFLGDLVITSDVPLADRVVDSGAIALNPKGKVYDKNNIKEELLLRNMRQELREMGQITGGPSTMSGNDINRFASSFDKLIQTKILK